MENKIIFVAVLILAFVLIVVLGVWFLFFYQPDNTLEIIEAKLSEFNPYKVNDCEIIMRQQNLTYALCAINTNNVTVLRNSYLNCSVSFGSVVPCILDEFNTVFQPTEYLGLQVNMQKLDIPFESYYTCYYSDFPLYETAFPAQYNETGEGIYYSGFGCSSHYSKEFYHHWALSGFVLNKKGEYTIIRVYVFDGSLPSNYDFKNNLNKGVRVLEVMGEIK